jgi:prepilin-type N-terminal cleavage/methylation domain-containing protein
MRHGITLMELTVVLVIVGVLCAIGVPGLLRFLDRTRVRHATNEIVTMLALARTTAVAREAHIATLFDASRSSVTVTAGADTIVDRELGAVYGVTVRSNRDSTVYGPAGLGYGAANQTVIVRRGSAVDSVIVSRLGRVRR